MKELIKLLLVGLGMLISCVAVAQDDEETKDDIDLNVVLQGDAELFLNDANKVTRTPETKESVVELPSLSYVLLARKPLPIAELKPVPAAKVHISQPQPNLFRGYAKGAVGTKLTTYGELRFMDGYSRKGTYDMFIKHFGTDGFVSSSDSIPDSYSNFGLGLSGKRFLKKHAVGVDLDYNREKLHYYGYDPAVAPENFGVDEKRLYRTVDVGVFLKSYFRDSTRLNHFGRFDFIQFTDNANSSENNFLFHVDMNKMLKKNSDAGRVYFASSLDVDYNNLKNINPRTESEQTYKNTIIELNPRITMQASGFTTKLGVRLVGDFVGGPLNPHIYPDIEAKYNLFDGLFKPYAGIGGGLHRNRYRTLTEENPFLQNFIREIPGDDDILFNTNEKVNIYGGIRGNISNDMSFNANVSRASFDDFVYYVTDSLITPGNRFRAEYGDLKRTTVTGELTFNEGKRIKLFAQGQFYLYDERENGEEAWNQPNNKISISAHYNIQNKLRAELEVYALGQRRAKSLVELETVGELEEGEFNAEQGFYTYDLKRFIDGTLKVEYNYTKRLSAFIQVNNFLAARYVRFANYPVQRFNFMGGATYSF